MTDLSLIVNIFREGRLIHPTLVSLRRCLDEAIARGFDVEVVLVCDRTDRDTFRYLDEQAPVIFESIPWFELHVDHGDLGLARNSGVAFARGRFVAVSDDDNLYSPNWLADGVQHLIEARDDVVVHPEYMVQFGASNVLWKTPNSEDDSFDPRGMVEHNYWDAAAIAPRALYSRIPFAPSMAGPGFGPEDWHWNAQVLAAGVRHIVVPGTALFYRVKARGSLLSRLLASKSILAPTAYLRAEPSLPVETRADMPESSPALLPPTPDVPVLAEASPPTATADASRAPRPTARRRLLLSVRWVARPIARLLLPPFRAIARTHPRFEAFGRTVWGGMRTLVAVSVPPPVVVEIPAPQERTWAMDPPPDWLVTQWRDLHEIEPHLFPDAHTLATLSRWEPRAGLVSSVYWDLVRTAAVSDERELDYVFLVPWLAPGGATQVLFNYVQAILQEQPDARILVLSTERIPDVLEPIRRDYPTVSYESMPSAFHELPLDLQDRVLATFLVQFAPRRIHLINSPVGYRAYASYARALASRSALYTSLFTIDHSPEGRRTHYFLDSPLTFIDYLSGVFVDNEPLARSLTSLLGVSPDRFLVHHQPLDGRIGATPVVARNDGPDEMLRVLWAGRFDRQKRPDVLLRIAARARELSLPVRFFAAGMAVLDDAESFPARLADNGIDYLGPFAGSLDSIGASFDVFLLTSEWEGLPLTMLDAARQNLTIVAPPVGGVVDFVKDGQTGFLVADVDDIESYIDVLTRLRADWASSVDVRRNAARLSLDRHGWDAFAHAVAATEGYMS